MTIKTIRMPKAILDKWLAALRSGKYKQTQNHLEKDGGYCCLGVLQCVVDGTVEKAQNTEQARRFDCEVGESLGLPTFVWMSKYGIQSHGMDGPEFETKENPIVYYPSDSRFECDNYMTVAELNDNEGLNFKEIADLVEACTETY